MNVIDGEVYCKCGKTYKLEILGVVDKDDLRKLVEDMKNIPQDSNSYIIESVLSPWIKRFEKLLDRGE